MTKLMCKWFEPSFVCCNITYYGKSRDETFKDGAYYIKLLTVSFSNIYQSEFF